jgi:hypothetical protein
MNFSDVGTATGKSSLVFLPFDGSCHFDATASLHGRLCLIGCARRGEVAERFKAHAWKACWGESPSGVRIPVSPPCRSGIRSLFRGKAARYGQFAKMQFVKMEDERNH